MSKISLSGNASGTGTLTIASQNTNSNYTLTIPNATGTIITTAGGDAISGTTGTFSSTIQGGATISVGGATPSTSGAGITFPATQSASTDANTLDDYEEGTWTPSLGGNTTYAGRYGTYTKIGNLVYVNFYVEVTTLGTGSTSTFSGLPFSGTSGQQGMGFSTYQANLAISPVSLGPTIVSSTSVRFDGRTAAAATASATLAIYGNGAAVYGSMVYTT